MVCCGALWGGGGGGGSVVGLKLKCVRSWCFWACLGPCWGAVWYFVLIWPVVLVLRYSLLFGVMEALDGVCPMFQMCVTISIFC